MTSKHFIATILGLAMTVTSISALPARAMSEEDVAKLLFGITTLAIIGAAVSDRDDPVVTPVSPVRPTPRREVRPSKPYQYNLPHRCSRNFRAETGRIVQDYSFLCLQRAHVDTDRLPQKCFQRTRSDQGRMLRGFRTQCLSRKGYRVSWR